MPSELSGPRRAAVIVAHPDDETLWAGGTILSHSDWDWSIAALCRASDPDRAPEFFRVMQHLGARGGMGDLDDGPEQVPLAPEDVQRALLDVLRWLDGCSSCRFDLVLTHGPHGEYTRHRRHEEVSAAVLALWTAGEIQAGSLWLFAYEDGGRAYYPRPQEGADVSEVLPESVWREKYHLITDVYGFAPDSWEAHTTPATEAFWRFESPDTAARWAMAQVSAA
jgi:LmbE family N-acetylglucosaminyl deacetylase